MFKLEDPCTIWCHTDKNGSITKINFDFEKKSQVVTYCLSTKVVTNGIIDERGYLKSNGVTKTK
jgi:hypothetical protein